MGWVRVYENLSGHWLWEDKPFAKGQAWIDLLLDAEWRDGRQIRLGREIIVLKRGQQSVTLRDLADRWGWSKDKVSRFLKLLEEQGMISAEKTQAGQVLTIENYEKYQNDTRGERDTSETQVRHERDTSAKPSYIYQNRRITESQTYSGGENDAVNRLVEDIPEECRETFKDFVEYREANGVTMTYASGREVIAKAMKYSNGDTEKFNEILRQTMRNGWKAIVPLEDDRPKRTESGQLRGNHRSFMDIEF